MGGAEDFHETVCVCAYANAGWGWAEAAQECVLGRGGFQWLGADSVISSFTPALLKLSFSLPALYWHQAVLPTQELVVPTALEGSQSSLSLRDGQGRRNKKDNTVKYQHVYVSIHK